MVTDLRVSAEAPQGGDIESPSIDHEASDISATPPDTGAAKAPSPAELRAVNEVRLAGVLADLAEERELAGGVLVVRWTLRVPRGRGKGGGDLIDCVAVDADMRSRALDWPEGLALTVEGALRRRFFRSGGRTATRVEVEAHTVTELAAEEPGQRADDPPAPSDEARAPADLPAGAGDPPARRRRGLLRRAGG